MEPTSIKILNIKITKKNFPYLYNWAKINPNGLAETLKSLAEASGGDAEDYDSVAVNLESDLAHG